jgi:hypothetical protein
MLKSHEQLQTIIRRYTPTMLDAIDPAASDEVAQLEARAGLLPNGYSEFLGWMGNRCPFLDGEGFAYSPKDLLEVYNNPNDAVPEGFILIGLDRVGDAFDLHIRREDGIVIRLNEFFDGSPDDLVLIENLTFQSYLLTTYIRRTLVPSHPFNFAAAFKGRDETQVNELWRRVADACAHIDIPFHVDLPDFRFYGGNDTFVLGLHRRPQSSIVHLHFGAIERSRFEPWYDLVFARWRLLRMPA